MAKTDQEISEKYRARVKKQNEKAKEKWDTVSCRLPKGTKKRIEEHGFTVNGYINALVLADLERLENAGRESIAGENEEPRKADKKGMDKAEFDELNEIIKRLQKENKEGKLAVSYKENVADNE